MAQGHLELSLWPCGAPVLSVAANLLMLLKAFFDSLTLGRILAEISNLDRWKRDNSFWQRLSNENPLVPSQGFHRVAIPGLSDLYSAGAGLVQTLRLHSNVPCSGLLVRNKERLES